MNALLEELTTFDPKHISKIYTPFPISVERISEKSEYRPAIIYVGYQSEVQQSLINIHQAILFLIEDIEEFSLPFNQKNDIVVFQKDVDIFRLMEECRNIIRRRVLLDSKSRILLECINRTDNLEEIISVIEQQIENPIIVLDISYKILGYSKNYEVEDYQWQQNIKRGYCSFEYIGGFNHIEVVATAPNSNDPFIVECFTSPLRRYISKLYLNGRQLGYLLAIESKTPFSQIDPEFFKLISSSLARVINTHNQLTQNINNRMYDSVFIDCIEGAFKSRSAFMERISMTGLKTDSQYQLLSINISSYNNFDPSNETLRKLINQVFPGCWIVCYNNNVVVLVDIQTGNINVVNALKPQEKIFRQYKLRAGISDVFSDLFEIAIHYHNADTVNVISSVITPDVCFALYDDYKVYHLMYTAGREEHLQGFIHSSVKRILKYDETNNTDYFDTMYSYLRNARRLDDTAKDLYIHKNTVSYRINRIREIFSIDFDDPNIEFNLFFSCKMVTILNQHVLDLPK